MDEANTDPRMVGQEESGIALDERGRWLHQGAPVEHKRIQEFFHRAIRKDKDGRYYLENAFDGKQERVYFAVADTAYFILHLVTDEARTKLHASLNTGQAVEVDPASLVQDERGVLYCQVLDADRARVTTNALHDLSELVEERDGRLVLQLAGSVFDLAAIAE